MTSEQIYALRMAHDVAGLHYKECSAKNDFAGCAVAFAIACDIFELMVISDDSKRTDINVKVSQASAEQVARATSEYLRRKP